MSGFSGSVKLKNVLVQEKKLDGSIPVVHVWFMGGALDCYQSTDLMNAVNEGDEFESVEFEIQLDEIGNRNKGTTHLFRPVDGTIKLDGKLVQGVT
jgi:hypothetical protein